ncbi:MAG TPA: site-specific DNA-methyltransferase [Candidatus Sulfotelmatobacter sp.]|nr:site-specific DNA-methyltransferase [Candidatus Sulfotelmatobacter sp.]
MSSTTTALEVADLISKALVRREKPARSSSTIYAADASGMLRVLEEESVDLVITSPPYAERRKKAYGGTPADQYVEWFLPIAAELLRVLKPTGSFVLNIKEGVHEGERQTYVYELVLRLRKQGWLFVDEFIWHKTNPFPTGNRNRLKDGFERCYHFAKTKKFKFFPNEVRTKSTSKWAGDNARRKNQGAHHTRNLSGMNMSKRVVGDLVRPSNVLTMPASSLNGIGHPAVFPLGLPEFFIRLMTEPGDTVLDPFMGSGTTALATRKLDRRYEGVEVVQPYLERTARRLAEDFTMDDGTSITLGEAEY